MTKQQIFDKAAKHLLRQRKRAATKLGSCRYRTKDGARCAIGCLIPKRLYNSRIEGLGAGSFVVPSVDSIFDPAPSRVMALAIGKKIGLRKAHRQLLIDLQNIHDDVHVKQWRAELRDLARKHKLVQKVVR